VEIRFANINRRPDTGTVTGFPAGAYHEIRHGLFEPTTRYDGPDWGADVLTPWTAANADVVDAVRRAGGERAAAVAFEPEDRWALYALSRVAELLILPHQPAPIDPGEWSGWLPSAAWRQFIDTIGGTFPEADGFHPFLHEIAAVEPAGDPGEPPTPTAEWWPGCMIGSLLLVRAGVTVRAGRTRLDPVVAAGSTLYWAWERRYRPVDDLSHGWGSNSQWRTGFRRDYLLPGRLLYSVDAGGIGDVELLRHRCRTLVADDGDAWPYDSHHTEERPTGW
jgi:hypothetical protein